MSLRTKSECKNQEASFSFLGRTYRYLYQSQRNGGRSLVIIGGNKTFLLGKDDDVFFRHEIQ